MNEGYINSISLLSAVHIYQDNFTVGCLVFSAAVCVSSLQFLQKLCSDLVAVRVLWVQLFDLVGERFHHPGELVIPVG